MGIRGINKYFRNTNSDKNTKRKIDMFKNFFGKSKKEGYTFSNDDELTLLSKNFSKKIGSKILDPLNTFALITDEDQFKNPTIEFITELESAHLKLVAIKNNLPELIRLLKDKIKFLEECDSELKDAEQELKKFLPYLKYALIKLFPNCQRIDCKNESNNSMIHGCFDADGKFNFYRKVFCDSHRNWATAEIDKEANPENKEFNKIQM